MNWKNYEYFTSPKTAMAVLTSPQREVEAETPRQSHEELLDSTRIAIGII